MIRKVLLGIGGTPFGKTAVLRAVELCQHHGAELTAVTTVDMDRIRNVGSVPIGGGPMATELREHRLEATTELLESTLEELEAACEASKVRLTIHREKGVPFNLMVAYARYHDVSVFGLRSMFESELMGHHDINPAHLLNRMTVGGVRPLIATSEQFRPIRRVLLAYGGSIRAAEAMKQFVRLQLWPDATIRIVSCKRSELEANQLLNDAADYCNSYGYEVQCRHHSGQPTRSILSEASQWQADMIVMGSTTEGTLVRKVFGSTAMHMLEKSDFPLFLGY